MSGGTSYSRSMPATRSGNSASDSERAERLTATGMRRSRSSHCRHWASEARSTWSVRIPISPVTSASGTNRSGATSPNSGWFQRTSASTPTRSRERRLIFGW